MTRPGPRTSGREREDANVAVTPGEAVRTNYRRSLRFHLRIGDAPPDAPAAPADDVLALRASLLREECDEALRALEALRRGEGELADLAHELADVLYVTYGTFVALGIDADEVFAEVDAANLRKVGGARHANGKQGKPAGWRPPDVAGVLERQRAGASQGAAARDLRAGDGGEGPAR